MERVKGIYNINYDVKINTIKDLELYYLKIYKEKYLFPASKYINTPHNSQTYMWHGQSS